MKLNPDFTMNDFTRKVFFIFSLCFGYLAVNAQLITLDPQVRRGILSNGFTYYIRKNTTPAKTAQFFLASKAGSILELDNQRGLAHFIEHMSFNGTKHFPKNELIDYLQKAGVRFGADLNAYTSYDRTVYQLPIPTGDPELFRQSLIIMKDWAQGALLETNEIDKERGVILEERRLKLGVRQRFQELYLPVLLNGSKYAYRQPIGQEDILKNFKPEVLREFYHDWYRPNLQALIIVGNIDVEAVEKQVKELFSDLRNPLKEKMIPDHSIKLLGKNQFIALTDPEERQTTLELVFKFPGEPVETEAQYLMSIKDILVNEMLSKRFSVLSRNSVSSLVKASAGINMFSGGLKIFTLKITPQSGMLRQAFSEAWTEIERLKKFGFTPAELSMAKTNYIVRLSRAFTEKDKISSTSLAKEYLEHFLDRTASPGIDAEYTMAQKLLATIDLKTVNAYNLSLTHNKDRDVVLLAPELEKKKLPSESDLNLWIKEISRTSLKQQQDAQVSGHFFSGNPMPGAIIKSVPADEVGLTRLTLNNGLKLILKPTSFKNDEVLFTAYSPGGTSLYNNQDYLSAAVSASLVNTAGLADFSADQLSRILNGKNVNVTAFINENEEGLSGKAGLADLETALQLVYLYFTSSGKDLEPYRNILTKQRNTLALSADNPAKMFSDTITATLSGYNPRRMPLTSAQLDQIDLKKSMEIFKERFASAGDFTFLFVGNFEIEKLKPLLVKYLGSLPGKGTELPIQSMENYPLGGITKTVIKGKEDKATVRMVYTGNYSWNDQQNFALTALGQILQYRLTSRLREVEGGVYTPSTSTSFSKLPNARYSVNIAFNCSPQNADRLIEAAISEIILLKNEGPTQEDLQKFKAERMRQFELQVNDNKFWLAYLLNCLQMGEEPSKLLKYRDRLEQVTVQDIQNVARNLLNDDQLIKFKLLPET